MIYFRKGPIKKIHYQFILFYLIFFCQVLYGQKSIDKNSITAEVLGHSRSLISGNYERLINLSPDFLVTIRTGIGFSPGVIIGAKRRKGIITTPIVFSFLGGGKKNFIQLSAGYTAAFGHDFIDSTTTTPTIYQKFESAYIMSLGYRYMWNGFVGQVFPLVEWTNNHTSKFSVGGGVSIGVTF